MFLIIGLGNPGNKYEFTRHNIGFLLLDRIVSHYKLSVCNFKGKIECYSGFINEKKILATKPLSYMNLSGEEIGKIVNFYKIDIKNIAVAHDDIDLELSRVKVKIGGGDGGHNGIKNIDQNIGKNYLRLRFGIGRPENPNFSISNFVLSNFKNEELNTLEDKFTKIIKYFPDLIEGKIENFINKIL